MLEGKLERLYFAITGDSCSIYHRPTYQYMYSCKTGDVVKEAKKLLSMSTKEFYKFLLNDLTYFRLTKPTHNRGNDEDREKWYQGAWKIGTDRVLKENNLTMKYEEIPWDYVEELQNSKKSGWSTGAKKSFSYDKEFNSIVKTKTERRVKKIKKVDKHIQPTKGTKDNAFSKSVNKVDKRIKKKLKKRLKKTS